MGVYFTTTFEGVSPAALNTTIAKERWTELMLRLAREIYYVGLNKALHIIETGEGMPDNTGLYMDRKYYQGYIYKQSMGGAFYKLNGATAHPLGRLSGDLYYSVGNTTRGFESADSEHGYIDTIFTEPEYIDYVHNGKPGVLPRPFMDAAQDFVNAEMDTVIAEAVERRLNQWGLGMFEAPMFKADSLFKGFANDVFPENATNEFHMP